MIETSGPLLASQSSGIGIHSELQPLAMYVIGQGFDPTGKSGGVRNNVPLGIAADLPAVVDIDVLVAGGLQATADHRVCHFADQLFAYFASKLVPTVPAHRWSLCQSLYLGGAIRREKK